MDTAQEIYTTAIRPLPARQRLRLAALILNGLNGPDGAVEHPESCTVNEAQPMPASPPAGAATREFSTLETQGVGQTGSAEAAIDPDSDSLRSQFWTSPGPSAPVDLARLQGSPESVRFEDLLGDFWPEDETCDEFLTTLREWRSEGA